jgi:hypothetical protein
VTEQDQAEDRLLQLGRQIVNDLAGVQLAALVTGRQAEEPRARRVRVAPAQRVYHPARIGGRKVLAILAHDASPTHLYELEPEGSGHFAEGQHGHPGPVLRSDQFDAETLKRAHGWREESGE